MVTCTICGAALNTAGYCPYMYQADHFVYPAAELNVPPPSTFQPIVPWDDLVKLLERIAVSLETLAEKKDE